GRAPASGRKAAEVYKALLAAAPHATVECERTTVVCVSPVQFATGSQVDVAALVARARDVGARVVVDVTQMAGAAPVTMTHWGVDALGVQRLQVAVRAARRGAARHYREPGGAHPRDRRLERQRHAVRLHPAGALPGRGCPQVRA